jgi:hypothetical protein
MRDDAPTMGTGEAVASRGLTMLTSVRLIDEAATVSGAGKAEH